MTKKGELILGNYGKNGGNPKKQSSKFHGGLFCKSRPKVMAKGYGQIKNGSDQKSDATFTNPTFDD